MFIVSFQFYSISLYVSNELSKRIYKPQRRLKQKQKQKQTTTITASPPPPPPQKNKKKTKKTKKTTTKKNSCQGQEVFTQW